MLSEPKMVAPLMPMLAAETGPTWIKTTVTDMPPKSVVTFTWGIWNKTGYVCVEYMYSYDGEKRRGEEYVEIPDGYKFWSSIIRGDNLEVSFRRRFFKGGREEPVEAEDL